MEKPRAADHTDAKSRVTFLSADSPFRSRDLVLNKIPLQAASILDKNVRGSNIVAEGLFQRPSGAGPLPSVKAGRERVKKRREIAQQLGPRVSSDSEKGRLSYAQRLQLFRALVSEALPFLELRSRFGVSKQSLSSLVKNGLLTQVWGPNTIGVRFQLSKRGKRYLKALEEAVRYKPIMKEAAVTRLKQGTPPL